MTRTCTIGEAARRSGFPTATLRYYDELGLVVPAARSDAGYRRYDERDLERLRFVGRAKQLGCSLDEIGDLLTAWDGGECGPVQDRLRTLVAAKIEDGHDRLVELSVLLAELQRAAATLNGHRPAGSCDDACGCISDQGAGQCRDGTEPDPVAFGRRPDVACTLEPGLMPQRSDDFRRLLTSVRSRDALERGVRLEFEEGIDVGELATLIRAEHECCSFWEFSVTIDGRGVGLEVRGPDGVRDLIDALFGVAA